MQSVILGLEEGPAIITNPPNDGSPSILRVKESLVREFVESGKCTLIREPDLFSHFAGEQDGVLCLHEQLENLTVVHGFLPSTWHQSHYDSQCTYYQVLNRFVLETGCWYKVDCYLEISFSVTTKLVRCRQVSQQEPIADPSLAGGSTCDEKRTPMLVASGPREVLREGAEPMEEGNTRGLETSATEDEQTPTDTGAAETRLAEADKQLELVADHLDDDLASSALERARIELAYARGHVAATEAER